MRRRRATDQGAAALEFALISAFALFPILLGMLQYGLYFYVAQATESASGQAVRRLAVGDCWSGSQLENLIRPRVPGFTSVTKTPSDLSTADIGDTITVRVVSDGKIIGFLPLPNSGQVDRTVTSRLEDKVAGTC